MTQQEFFKRYQYNRQNDHLGGGGFGTVYKAYDSYKSEYLALKIAEVKKGQESLSLLKEVELAKDLPDHPNIVHYIDCQRYDLPSGLFDFGLLQYYPKGNLSQLIQKEKLSHVQKEAIAQGIIRGLAYLHQNDVVHRDLKSSNILMAQHPNGEYIPKIADFGLSKQIKNSNNSYFSNSFGGGSLLYAAPEQLTAGNIRKNVDLWSLGIVLYELFLGKLPFFPTSDIASETGRVELVKKINSGVVPNELRTIPQNWQHLIASCLIPDANKRVKTIKEVQQILEGTLKWVIPTNKTPPPRDKEPIPDYTEIDEPEPRPPSPKPSIPSWLWYVLGGLGFVFLIGKFILKDPELEPSKSDEVIERVDTTASKEEKPVSKSETKTDTESEKRPRAIQVEEEAWRAAAARNTPSAYAGYLAAYPAGKYVKEAKKKKGALEEAESLALDRQRQADAAEKARKTEDTAWEKARSKHTTASYHSYLSEYPSGRYINEARQQIKIIEESPQLPAAILSLEKNMLAIEGGSFTMGCSSEQENCNDNEKAHKVSLSSFKLNKYEVTQAEWEAVMGTTIEQQRDKANPDWPLVGVGSNYPMYYISWEEAQEFIKKLNKMTGGTYRLPTEAEWEYAARGGKKSRGYQYSGSNDIGSVAEYEGNNDKSTKPVGGKSSNELGLYDMSGNVWEWCSDWYEADYYKNGPENNPKGPSTGSNRVLRGGSWSFAARRCRLAFRSGFGPGDRGGSLGFRLAASR